MDITAKSWSEEQQDWLKQHREKQVQETGQQQKSLATEIVEQGQRKAEDRLIKNPGMFIKGLNNILKQVQLIREGASERLKHSIIEFLNEFTIKARKGEAVLPATFQVLCLKDAAEFDKTGDIIKNLCGLFNENYESTIRRKFEAAALLRKIASTLLKLIS